MGIFRDFTKTLKKAAPIIGAGIGMYFGGPMGASIGSGIGSLASGRSTEEALMNAALAGGTAYLATGAGTPGAGMKNFDTANSPLRGLFGSTSVPGGDLTGNTFGTQIKSAGSGDSGMMSFLKDNKYLIGGGLGLAALAGGEKEKNIFKDPYAGMPDGRVRLGTGMVGDQRYNLNDEAQRKAYFTANQNRGLFAKGGAVKGYNAGGYENSTLSDLYRLANDVEFSEGEQGNIRSALDKKIGGRTGFDALPTEQLRMQLKGTAKAGHTEMDLREIERVLAKRSAPKTPMMDPYMGDPSQLMRNFMVGGEVRGPGSGTSDSVPARLSDGEFVVTADAVRGAGGGDRNVGAARMYDMMSQLEGAA